MDLKIFPLKPLSEEEIMQHNYDLIKLWMVSHEHQVYGPYLEEELKSFLLSLEHKNHFLNIQLCNLENEKWLKRNECSFLSNTQAYLLHPENSQHSYSDILHLFREKKISLESQISSDQGQSFKSLKDIPEFIGLVKKNFNLPDFLDGDDLFYDKTLQIKINEKKQKEDPVTKLVANMNQSKSQQTQIIQMTKAIAKQTSASVYTFVLLFIASSVAGYQFYTSKKQPTTLVRTIQSVEKPKNLTPEPVRTPAAAPIQRRIPVNVDIDGIEIKKEEVKPNKNDSKKEAERILSVIKELKNLPTEEGEEEENLEDTPEEENQVE